MPTDPYQSPDATLEGYRPDEDRELGRAVLEELRRTRPWVRFLSVMMFLGAGFMILGGFVFVAAASQIDEQVEVNIAIGIMYLVMGAVWIYPAVKLFQYASAITRVQERPETSTLAVALREQRRFWVFMGISTIAIIALYALLIAGAIVFAMSVGSDFGA